MRKLALLLGMAAAALGVWWMLSTGQSPQTPASSSARAADQGREPGMALVARDEANEPTVEPGDQAARVAVDTATAPGKTARILVRRRGTGEALPGTEVWYFETFSRSHLSPEDRAAYRRLEADRERLTQRYGARLIADGSGFVTIPVRRQVLATGRQGDLYGQLDLRPSRIADDGGGYELELDRDVSLTVQVLDVRGEPAAGIPVAVLPLWDGALTGLSQVREVGVTEPPDGLSRIPHVQNELLRFDLQQPAATGYLVRPHVPGYTEGRAFAKGESPAETLVFQLPATGSVVVEVTNTHGETVPEGIVRTRVALAIATGDVRDAGEVPRYRRWNATHEEGGAQFPRVVVGQEFFAQALVGWGNLEQRFAGPSAEGQDVAVTMSLEEDPFFFVGRAVDAAGEPIQGARLEFSYQLGERVRASTSGHRTDEQGQFRLLTGIASSSERTLTHLTVQDEHPGTVYRWQGERRLVPGDNDLGELTLRVPLPIATGQILVNGRPPDHERFRFWVHGAEMRGSEPFWRSEPDLRVRILDEGRFEVRGEPNWTRQRLFFRDPDYLPIPPVEFATGAGELSVELSTGGSFEARVLMDGPELQDDLILRFVPQEGQGISTAPDPEDGLIEYEAEDWLHGARTTIGGQTYRWQSLWPGRYRVEATTRGASQAFVSVSDIRVTAGQANSDSRLDPLDLRGKLRNIAVTIAGPDGSPLDPESEEPMVLRGDLDGGRVEGFGARGNPARVLTGEPYIDFVAAARRYRPKEVTGVRADTVVTLEPYPTLVVRFAGGRPTMPDDHALTVVIGKDGDGHLDDRRRVRYERGTSVLRRWLLPPQSDRITVDERGEVVFPVDAVGEYSVTVTVHDLESGGTADIEGVMPARLEVGSLSDRQVFEIEIPSPGLHKAIAAAKR